MCCKKTAKYIRNTRMEVILMATKIKGGSREEASY